MLLWQLRMRVSRALGCLGLQLTAVCHSEIKLHVIGMSYKHRPSWFELRLLWRKAAATSSAAAATWAVTSSTLTAAALAAASLLLATQGCMSATSSDVKQVLYMQFLNCLRMCACAHMRTSHHITSPFPVPPLPTPLVLPPTLTRLVRQDHHD